jgi:hypothetical protein
MKGASNRCALASPSCKSGLARYPATHRCRGVEMRRWLHSKKGWRSRGTMHLTELSEIPSAEATSGL